MIDKDKRGWGEAIRDIREANKKVGECFKVIMEDVRKNEKYDKERFKKMMDDIREHNEQGKKLFKKIIEDIKKYNEKLYKEMTDPITPEYWRRYLLFWYLMTRI